MLFDIKLLFAYLSSDKSMVEFNLISILRISIKPMVLFNNYKN